MAERPEKKFETKLVAALEAQGAIVWKTHGGNASAGWPDLMVVRGGLTGWIEVKAQDPEVLCPSRGALLKRLSGRQGARCRSLAKAGVLVWVCAGTAGRRASGLEIAVLAKCVSTRVPAGKDLTPENSLAWFSVEGTAKLFLERLRKVADGPNLSLKENRPPSTRTGWGN